MAEVPSDLVMWSGLVAFAMPAAIAAVNRSAWSPAAKAVAAFLACAAAGAGTAWFSGHFAGREVVSAILVVFTLAIGYYHAWWRPSGLAGRIERATG